MTMQVADVQKVLAPTAKACDAGNIQVFTQEDGWTISKNESNMILNAVEKVGRNIDRMMTGGNMCTTCGCKMMKIAKGTQYHAPTGTMHWEQCARRMKPNAHGRVSRGWETISSERSG